MKKLKFKLGDEVRILPNCIDIGISKNEIGKIGTIVQYPYANIYRIHTKTSSKYGWHIADGMIEPAVRIGEQLVLWEWVNED